MFLKELFRKSKLSLKFVSEEKGQIINDYGNFQKNGFIYTLGFLHY